MPQPGGSPWDRAASGLGALQSLKRPIPSDRCRLTFQGHHRGVPKPLGSRELMWLSLGPYWARITFMSAICTEHAQSCPHPLSSAPCSCRPRPLGQPDPTKQAKKERKKKI